MKVTKTRQTTAPWSLLFERLNKERNTRLISASLSPSFSIWVPEAENKQGTREWSTSFCSPSFSARHLILEAAGAFSLRRWVPEAKAGHRSDQSQPRATVTNSNASSGRRAYYKGPSCQIVIICITHDTAVFFFYYYLFSLCVLKKS